MNHICINPRCTNTLTGCQTKWCSEKCRMMVSYYSKREKEIPLDERGKIDTDKSYKFYNMGMSVKQIADYFNVTPTAVRKSFRVRGYKLKQAA